MFPLHVHCFYGPSSIYLPLSVTSLSLSLSTSFASHVCVDSCCCMYALDCVCMSTAKLCVWLCDYAYWYTLWNSSRCICIRLFPFITVAYTVVPHLSGRHATKRDPAHYVHATAKYKKWWAPWRQNCGAGQNFRIFPKHTLNRWELQFYYPLIPRAIHRSTVSTWT